MTNPMLDSYARRAWGLPLLLLVLPVLGLVVGAGVAVDHLPASSLVAILLLGLAIALGGNEVRERGRTAEKERWARAGGSHTLHALRHRGGTAEDKLALRHASLGRFSGITPPTTLQEHEDPDAADVIYEAMLEPLRTQTRSDPVVSNENAQYGFLRNTEAVRVPGLIGAIVCAVIAIVLLVATRDPGWWLATGASAISFAAFTYVREAIVERQGRKYCEYLLKAIPAPPATN